MNVYEIVTERIVKQLEAGTAPWHKPWKARGKSGLPKNMISGHEYRGINTWVLLSSGFGNPYWLTYRQCAELGGHVCKGEKGFPVVYWKFGTREVQDGDDTIEKPSVLCRYYTVFNADQCEGLRVQPVISDEPVPTVAPIQACEEIVATWLDKPNIIFGGDRACYSKITDCVRIPNISAFENAEQFHSTLFHELVHSTGHPERLNRSSLTDFESFGDSNYSREELVAEMGAAYLCGYCGIENRTIDNSAAYLASWLKALKADPRLVLVAAGQAQKAADLILAQ